MKLEIKINVTYCMLLSDVCKLDQSFLFGTIPYISLL